MFLDNRFHVFKENMRRNVFSIMFSEKRKKNVKPLVTLIIHTHFYKM